MSGGYSSEMALWPWDAPPLYQYLQSHSCVIAEPDKSAKELADFVMKNS